MTTACVQQIAIFKTFTVSLYIIRQLLGSPQNSYSSMAFLFIVFALELVFAFVSKRFTFTTWMLFRSARRHYFSFLPIFFCVCGVNRIVSNRFIATGKLCWRKGLQRSRDDFLDRQTLAISTHHCLIYVVAVTEGIVQQSNTYSIVDAHSLVV